MSKKKKKQKRRRYSAEFKAEAVRLVREEEVMLSAVASNIGVAVSTLSRWVKQADVDAGEGAEGALTTEEKAELRQLRRENRQLRMEREILKKATAFFAKESR